MVMVFIAILKSIVNSKLQKMLNQFKEKRVLSELELQLNILSTLFFL